jgi:hypothetical protein
MRTLEILEQIKTNFVKKHRNDPKIKNVCESIINEFIDKTTRVDYNVTRTPAELITMINESFKCDVLDASRLRENVTGRFAISKYLKEEYNYTLKRTGSILNKNHGTIISYLKQHDNLMNYDSEYLKNYQNFKIRTFGKPL